MPESDEDDLVQESAAAAAGMAEASGDLSPPPIRLHQDERIIMDVLPSKWWTLGRYIFTLGAWAIWRQRHHFVLTNQRIVVTKGMINKSEGSAPLNRIQDAQLQRSPLTGGRIKLSTAGGPLGVDSIGPLTQADALAFSDALTPLLGAGSGGTP